MSTSITRDEFTKLEKKVLVIETKQEATIEDIQEIKNSQKETRYLIMTTLITSILGLIGIVFSFVR